MTTATLTRAAARPAGGHYGFRDVARMEWLKLRSVRSTWWTLLVFTAAMIGLAIPILIHLHWATMSAADRASFDPTNDSFPDPYAALTTFTMSSTSPVPRGYIVSSPAASKSS